MGEGKIKIEGKVKDRRKDRKLENVREWKGSLKTDECFRLNSYFHAIRHDPIHVPSGRHDHGRSCAASKVHHNTFYCLYNHSQTCIAVSGRPEFRLGTNQHGQKVKLDFVVGRQGGGDVECPDKSYDDPVEDQLGKMAAWTAAGAATPRQVGAVHAAVLGVVGVEPALGAVYVGVGTEKGRVAVQRRRAAADDGAGGRTWPWRETVSATVRGSDMARAGNRRRASLMQARVKGRVAAVAVGGERRTSAAAWRKTSGWAPSMATMAVRAAQRVSWPAPKLVMAMRRRWVSGKRSGLAWWRASRSARRSGGLFCGRPLGLRRRVPTRLPTSWG